VAAVVQVAPAAAAAVEEKAGSYRLGISSCSVPEGPAAQVEPVVQAVQAVRALWAVQAAGVEPAAGLWRSWPAAAL